MGVFKSKMSFIEYGAGGTEQYKNTIAQYRSSEARARAALTGERIALTDRRGRRPLARTAATASPATKVMAAGQGITPALYRVMYQSRERDRRDRPQDRRNEHDRWDHNNDHGRSDDRERRGNRKHDAHVMEPSHNSSFFFRNRNEYSTSHRRLCTLLRLMFTQSRISANHAKMTMVSQF